MTLVVKFIVIILYMHIFPCNIKRTIYFKGGGCPAAGGAPGLLPGEAPACQGCPAKATCSAGNYFSINYNGTVK